MDRLFGKELSNLLNHNIQNRQPNLARFHSKSSRGLNSDDPTKQVQKRVNKSTVCQDDSVKVQKI